MKPTEFRKKILSAGDVFTGIKTKEPNKRRAIESERHNVFMDMLGSRPAAEAGLKVNPNPVEWVKALVLRNGQERAEVVLREMLKIVENTDAHLDPLTKPYFDNKRHKKDLAFYRNAMGYFRNNLINKRRNHEPR